MSWLRNILPVGLAVGFGIWNAQYVFKPALVEERRKREEQELAKAQDRGAAQSQGKDDQASFNESQPKQ